MGDDQEQTGPSLEPPSLFRRRKKKAAAPEPAAAVDSPTTILDDVEAQVVAEAEVEMTQPLAPPVPPTPDAAPAPAAVRRERIVPEVPGRVAAAVAGLLAGAVIVGLTAASFEICSAIRETDSCGNGGILLLVAILVIAVLVGSVVLRVLKVPEPGSTSFLAVGLTSVIALLFLVDLLFEWWMVIVIPLVSVVMFVCSHWVTTTFVETAKPVSVVDEPEVVDHDVR